MRGTPDRPPGAGRRASPPRSPTSAAAHRGELEELIATRTTQTNEVGRCTALLPGLCHVAALLRLATSRSRCSTSARRPGLNLLFDDYAYTYRARRGRRHLRTAGRAGSGVRCLRVHARDDLDRPARSRRLLPWPSGSVSTSRPSTPSPTTSALWLLACQWPDNPARFGRLRAALDNVRATPDPPRLVERATW